VGGGGLYRIHNVYYGLIRDNTHTELAGPSRKLNPRLKQTASRPGLSSTKPAAKTKSGQKKSGPPLRARVQTVELEDGDDDDDDDDDARSTVQKFQAKKTSTAKVTTKGKGKAKAEPKGATSVSKTNGVNGKGLMTEDEDEEEGEEEDIRPIPRVAPPPPKSTHKPTSSNNSLVKENERLKRQVAVVCYLPLSSLIALMVEILGYRRARRCYAEIHGARAATTNRN
jgi:hypothetical protein